MAQVEGSGTVGVAATTEAENEPCAPRVPSSNEKAAIFGTMHSPLRPHWTLPIPNVAVAFSKVMEREGVAPD
jgi:hypothetical protein